MKKKRLLIYSDSVFVADEGLTIAPYLGAVPDEEVDITEAKHEDIEKFRKNPKDKKLIDKFRKKV